MVKRSESSLSGVEWMEEVKCTLDTRNNLGTHDITRVHHGISLTFHVLPALVPQWSLVTNSQWEAPGVKRSYTAFITGNLSTKN